MKILIISHDASRTGAPILLLNLASALKSKGIVIDFLLKRGGSLEEDFRAQGHTTIFYKDGGHGLLSKVRRKLFKPRHANISKLSWGSYDVVLSNTITNGDILPEIRKYYKDTIISYVHELEMAARFFTSEGDERLLVQHTDLFAAPCQTVRQFLMDRYQLPGEKVKILHYFIPAKKSDTRINTGDHNSFIVGGAGTVDWRKSPDLFVQTAVQLLASRPGTKIKFIWKGAPDGGTDLERVRYDIKKAGLKESVEFLPASPDMGSFYRSLDVFLLTSREDPYPLVVLEAADASVPAICFAGAGGATEFVEQSGGVRIPYLDTSAMARALLHYYDDRTAAQECGRRARQLLTDTHQNTQYITDQFESIVKATR